MKVLSSQCLRKKCTGIGKIWDTQGEKQPCGCAAITDQASRKLVLFVMFVDGMVRGSKYQGVLCHKRRHLRKGLFW